MSAVNCARCGTALPFGGRFCDNCREKAPVANPSSSAHATVASSPEQSPEPGPRRLLVPLAAGACAVLIISGLAIAYVIGSASSPHTSISSPSSNKTFRAPDHPANKPDFERVDSKVVGRRSIVKGALHRQARWNRGFNSIAWIGHRCDCGKGFPKVSESTRVTAVPVSKRLLADSSG